MHQHQIVGSLAVVAAVFFACTRAPGLADDEAYGAHVMITGGSSGIGEELAFNYAERGAAVIVLAGRRGEMLNSVAGQCLEKATAKGFHFSDGQRRPPLEVHAVPTDFLLEDSWRTFLDTAKPLLKDRLDVLHLNHAWISTLDAYTSRDTEGVHDALSSMMQVTFKSLADTALGALSMLEAGRGRIIVTSSAAGVGPVAEQSGYSAAKHALHGFFASLRQDLLWHRSNVTVTMGVIGRIDTDGAATALKNKHKFVRSYPAADAADALIEGGLRRWREVVFPATQLKLASWFFGLLPAWYDAVVALSAHSHPCTDCPDWLKLWNCRDQLLELI